MIGGLNPFPWHRVAVEAVAGAITVTDDPREIFLIQPVNLWHTFAFRLIAFTAGTVLIKVRFSISVPPAVIAGHGFDAPAVLGATGLTLMANTGAAIGAAIPAVAGNQHLIMPPVGRVYITTVGFTGTYEVWATYLGGA